MSGAPTSDGAEPAPVRPTLRIVHGGSPSAEEVAVLTAILAASSGGGEEPTPPTRSRWADPAHLVRRPLRSGPGAWSASGRK